jgi:hypothetical protein
MAAFFVRKLMEEKEIEIDTNEQKEKFEKSKLSNQNLVLKSEFLTSNQNFEPLEKDTKTKLLPTTKELAKKNESTQKKINTIEGDVKALKNDLKTILKILENPTKQPVSN